MYMYVGENSRVKKALFGQTNFSWIFFSCAAETLSTLKFAQRAKFIQNNVSVSGFLLKIIITREILHVIIGI